MSTKYDSPDRRLVEDDVALTDHAIERFRQRTPHDCNIDPRAAYQLGEDIKHPEVAMSDGQDTPPDRVRVYTHSTEDSSHAWGIAFLINEADGVEAGRERQPYIVATVIDYQTFDHGPSRAYLHSHGPHGGAADV